MTASGQAFEIVVIGASWGGLHALGTVVRALPETFTTPVLLVQHRARDADGMLTQLLQDETTRPVVNAEEGQRIARSHVYVAPPDEHVLMRDGHFALSSDAPVRFSRPSIDVSLIAAADAYGACAIGVVLTGANDDGARGLRRVVESGGWAVVQTPETAEVGTMPQAALSAVRATTSAHCSVVPLDAIAAEVVRLVTAGPAPRVARTSGTR